MQSVPYIALDDISFSYTETQPPVHAIKGVTLAIDQGEFVAIIGPSGSGKSTLLNIIGTLEAPTRGVYRLGGQEVAALRDRDLSRLRATQIGFVFQNFNLIDHLSVFENVKLGLRFRHDGLVNTRERVIAAMDKVGIAHRADHLPRHPVRRTATTVRHRTCNRRQPGACSSR